MNKTAFITGASSGIGLELAHVFAKHGDDLVLAARSRSKLDKLKEELEKQHNIKVYNISKDLSFLIQPKKSMRRSNSKTLS